MERVQLPEETEELGEDCFSSCMSLSEVFLPKSLKRVGKCALPCLKGFRLWAYEGSAKGLLNSISFNRDNHLAWTNVLDDKGALRLTFPVPISRKASLDRLLQEAWDGEELCLDTLFRCIPDMTIESRAERGVERCREALSVKKPEKRGEHMGEMQRNCEEANFWGQIKKEGQGKAFVISQIEIKDGEKTLRFPKGPEFDSLSVKLSDWREKEGEENEIERLVIPKEMREFAVPDHVFPKLISIEVEEGAPFYARGVNLFSKEGKLLNFFRLDQPELKEESLLPFDLEGDLEIKGECLMALLAPVDTLVLPPKVRRVSTRAFYWHAPRRLVCSRVLAIEEMSSNSFYLELINMELIKEMVLTDHRAPLSIDLLSYWEGLESVSLPNGHRRYESRDGILYKNHGTTLVFIPPFHPQIRGGTFVVPWGVRRIGGKVFEGLDELKRVEMPDSVCKLEGAVFAECENLEYVRLSDNILRIPGKAEYKGAFRHFVVPSFYCCTSLTQVHFPKKLVSIGTGAFQDSSITRVELAEGTEELEEKCFNLCTQLSEVFLPKSLKRVGKGALPCFHEISIWAYEGTAKGLLSAVNYGYGKKNIALIHVLDDQGALRFTIPVPHNRCIKMDGPMRENWDGLLREAWDGEKVNLDALLQCMPNMTKESREEMVLMALCHLDKNDFAPFEKYRKRKLPDYGIELIERDKMEDFIHYLELAKPHRGVRKELLDYCNQTGHSQYIPLLLEADNQLTRGRGRASLEKGKFDL